MSESVCDASEPPTPPIPDFSPANLYMGSFTAVEREPVGPVPIALRLEQNRPNPFNAMTVLRFSVGEVDTPVRLAVYDLVGRLVCVLVDGTMEAGTHSVAWDGKDGSGRNVGSGVYVCRIDVRGVPHTQTRKMVLLR